nr:replication factor small subunit [Pandoravirus massiliensis]
MESDMQIESSTPSAFTTSLALAARTTTATTVTTVVSRSGARKVVTTVVNDDRAPEHAITAPLAQTRAYAGTAQYELPWVEKYRPLVLDDITGNTNAICYLKALAVDGNVPNLLLAVRMPSLPSLPSLFPCLWRFFVGSMPLFSLPLCGHGHLGYAFCSLIVFFVMKEGKQHRGRR